MKRDMDLIRNILFALEDTPFTARPVKIRVAGYEDSERNANHVIDYHVMLLHQAGLIQAYEWTQGDLIDWRPGYLTWEGQEFLAAIRDETTWRKALSRIRENAGDVTLSLVKEYLAQTALKTLGLN